MPDEPTPAGDDVVDATLASSLESLDEAHNYRDWIVSLCAPHLGASLLEVGAGHGTFTESFVEYGTVCAVEPGELGSERLSERFATDGRVNVLRGVVDDAPFGPPEAFDGGFDASVMINVLEHIEDEAGVLAEIARRVRPGGYLMIWVPAFMLLFSPFDHRLGHHRRYRRRELEATMLANGWEVVDSRYVNFPGWFSWLLLVRLARTEPTNAGAIRLFDRVVVPIVRWVETRLRMPFGQSVFLVARRPPEEASRLP